MSHCCSELHALAHRMFSSAIAPSTPKRSAIDLIRSGRNVPLQVGNPGFITDSESFGESSLRVNVRDLAASTALIFRELRRDA